MGKSALITGINGQDGSYLADLLLEKGYEVHGLIRRGATYPDTLKNIDHIKDKITLHFGDLLNEHDLCQVLSRLKPDEIYNLAAQSDVRISFDIPEYTTEVTALGYLRLLEAAKTFSPESRIYQASSSEMYGNAMHPQDETTPMIPENPYAVAKLFSYHMGRIYRSSYNMFISNGILFNHESPRRGLNFVTRKITNAAAKIKVGKLDVLKLGNLQAQRDWGYAKEYVEAMWLMLQQDRPSDYVIGTGETHTVRDFVEASFSSLDLDWTKYVKYDVTMLRPSETRLLLANPNRAAAQLGWKAQTKFRDLVKIMVESDLKLET
jgi:GDPmannose 4,6-dehydratase